MATPHFTDAWDMQQPAARAHESAAHAVHAVRSLADNPPTSDDIAMYHILLWTSITIAAMLWFGSSALFSMSAEYASMEAHKTKAE